MVRSWMNGWLNCTLSVSGSELQKWTPASGSRHAGSRQSMCPNCVVLRRREGPGRAE